MQKVLMHLEESRDEILNRLTPEDKAKLVAAAKQLQECQAAFDRIEADIKREAEEAERAEREAQAAREAEERAREAEASASRTCEAAQETLAGLRDLVRLLRRAGVTVSRPAPSAAPAGTDDPAVAILKAMGILA